MMIQLTTASDGVGYMIHQNGGIPGDHRLYEDGEVIDRQFSTWAEARTCAQERTGARITNEGMSTWLSWETTTT
ncbi:MAG TPA: hypothetical protein VHU77_11365 [Candidatus Limnocylindria bacterium]|jgi:hypothetical protein|nr:hypothetical protein [Candidatus Limnocylindria bacterium]